MSAVIFYAAYGSFPVLSSIDIILYVQGSSSPSVTVLLIFCSSSSGNVVHISSVVLSQFIIALAQSCLFSYHSSVGKDLYQLSCSASCLRLASFLHICTLLRFSHFTYRAN